MATTPRKLFEEVSTETKSTPKPGGIDGGRRPARGAIRIWLAVMFFMVMAMVVIGGLTRLTDSGLSITEWRPLTGALPPLTQAAWLAEFEKYQQIPQFHLLNANMTVDEFKFIFWWEWGHRQLGRFLGLFWAIGFIGFWATKRIPPAWTGRLFSIGVLIGIQGAVGWWMVHSGLQDGMVAVASYRLATHLGLAFITLGVMWWFFLLLDRTGADLRVAGRAQERSLFTLANVMMGLTIAQILLGALVAGIDAGRSFPTWPLMGDSFFPPEPFSLVPSWRNFFENEGTVQFMHRGTAYLLFLFGVYTWWRTRRSPHQRTRFASNVVLALMVVQMALGIVTVLHASPLELAITHQFGAVALWMAVIYLRYLARFPYADKLRG
ncbi:heme A synthase [Ketogulonicigenium vulgare]|uniref:Heme A synthase n=1 Tax=Ketogulonicigenium vulgare (strain WSH-001) TaxID=759362 RepID=F9Y6Y7_KETVW|nr:heme A synthase [Ketogulonicigenium vulgare]ADO42819.1 cytochrome oxidase assembly protein [Ketogulonicigenium vulgare Y25]AEM41004.1 cytochrome oxidase assembly [Ketogulonicigenium vulgare WSH-001]ALJ81155.1 heme A synthase [Ketogulonicigenium vulgare]ANW33903.1 heme A synthase [Ketogulonicigenium vulgare]AOZ54731.1 cytochrome oxidase assembly protein [Ketogulonicigenium vulgare]